MKAEYEKGELIHSRKYAGMKINRPIPWIGMPVYFKNIWRIVDNVLPEGFATTSMGNVLLMTYRREGGNFVLPGEPNATPMSTDFTDKLTRAYTHGHCFRIHDGLWQPCQSKPTEPHTFLAIPYGLSAHDVFPNNKLEGVEQDLKKLNTDGRTECAKCGKILQQLWMGRTNLSHCPTCE